MSVPLIFTEPEVDDMYPVKMFIVVDFPAPLGPTIARFSPLRISKETGSTKRATSCRGIPPFINIVYSISSKKLPAKIAKMNIKRSLF